MKQYLFCTKEGYTYDAAGYEVHNIQILGDATGENTLEAFENLKSNQPHLINSSINELMALEFVGEMIYDLEL